MMKTEALRLALEALEEASDKTEPESNEWCMCKICRAIDAIKAALEAKDEPVAWMYPDDLKRFETSETFAQAYSIEMVSPTHGETVPLYTTPPQRTWVGLTEKDICEAAVKSQEGISPRDDTLRFAIAIEAKLKEKNT